MADYDIPTSEPLPEPAQPAANNEPAAPTLLDMVWELVQTVLLAVVIFLVIRNVVQNFRIDGISMEPNFHSGQFLIVNRFAYCPGLHLDIDPLSIHLEKTWCVRPPDRGDVVIFEYPRDPSRDFIKRVIGLPGETVEIVAGKVYVDGQLLPEPFGPNPGSYTSGPITVAAGEVFVLGDNRNNSSDSHSWGLLPQDLIIGKAWLSYWPPTDWAVIPNYDLVLNASTP